MGLQVTAGDRRLFAFILMEITDQTSNQRKMDAFEKLTFTRRPAAPAVIDGHNYSHVDSVAGPAYHTVLYF